MPVEGQLLALGLKWFEIINSMWLLLRGKSGKYQSPCAYWWVDFCHLLYHTSLFKKRPGLCLNPSWGKWFVSANGPRRRDWHGQQAARLLWCSIPNSSSPAESCGEWYTSTLLDAVRWLTCCLKSWKSWVRDVKRSSRRNKSKKKNSKASRNSSKRKSCL